MVRFLIIRHGTSVNNIEKRFSGQMDVPLSEEGFLQAEKTAAYVLENYSPSAVYTSDLSRAYNTVAPIAAALGVDMIKMPGLREVDVGHWQGRTFAEVEKDFPEEYAAYRRSSGKFTFPGGEYYGGIGKRVIKALEEIAAENDGKTVVVGTHGGAIKNLFSVLQKVPPEKLDEIPLPKNASITEIVFENGNYTVLKTSFDGHLI